MLKKPSTSMVVALIALFVALSGVAVAGTSGLITGQQIKDHSIGMVDISNLAIAKLKGQRGPEGEPGPPGPQGVPGGFDPAKVSYVQGPQTTVLPFSVSQAAVTLVATCPAGTKAIAGGGYTSIGLVGASLPAPNGTGWALIMVNDKPITLTGVYAFAVCAAQ